MKDMCRLHAHRVMTCGRLGVRAAISRNTTRETPRAPPVTLPPQHGSLTTRQRVLVSHATPAPPDTRRSRWMKHVGAAISTGERIGPLHIPLNLIARGATRHRRSTRIPVAAACVRAATRRSAHHGLSRTPAKHPHAPHATPDPPGTEAVHARAATARSRVPGSSRTPQRAPHAQHVTPSPLTTGAARAQRATESGPVGPSRTRALSQRAPHVTQGLRVTAGHHARHVIRQVAAGVSDIPHRPRARHATRLPRITMAVAAHRATQPRNPGAAHRSRTPAYPAASTHIAASRARRVTQVGTLATVAPVAMDRKVLMMKRTTDGP